MSVEVRVVQEPPIQVMTEEGDVASSGNTAARVPVTTRVMAANSGNNAALVGGLPLEYGGGFGVGYDPSLRPDLEAEIASRLAADTTIQGSVTALTTVVAAKADRSELEQEVTDREDAVTGVTSAYTSAITSLTSTVNANKSAADAAFSDVNTAITQAQLGVDDNAAALTLAQAELQAAIDDEIAGRTSADTVLQGDISTLSATVTANFGTLSASISDEAVARANGDSALSGQITTLTATVTSNYSTLNAAITDEQLARADGDDALSSQITTVSAQASAQRVFIQVSAPGSTGRITGDLWLDSDDGLKPYYWNGSTWTDASDQRFTTIAASVTTEQTARVAGDTALASDITALTSVVGGNTAAISAEAVTRADADTALSGQITSLTSTVTSNYTTLDAAITAEQVARSDEDDALAGQITTLEATVTSNYTTLDAAITSEATARADADTAIASDVTTLSTTVGGHTTSISELITSVDGVKAQWAIQATIDGVTGGLVFSGIKRADGTGPEYNLAIGANVTISGDLLVDGSIIASKIMEGNVNNGHLVDHAASHSAMGIGKLDTGSVICTVRKGARVAIIATYTSALDAYNGATGTFYVTANGNNIISNAVFGYGYQFPITLMTVYTGSAGGNFARGGTATASAYYTNLSYGCVPSGAFDGVQSTSWVVAAASGWLQYQLVTGKTASSYKIKAVGDPIKTGVLTIYTPSANAAPKDWILKGSNDGSSWTNLDTQTEQTGWTVGEERTFTIASPASYTHYRLDISANQTGSYTNVCELELLETGDPPDEEDVVFRAYVNKGVYNLNGYCAIYVVELSK
jgi:hypothetical protein